MSRDQRGRENDRDQRRWSWTSMGIGSAFFVAAAYTAAVYFYPALAYTPLTTVVGATIAAGAIFGVIAGPMLDEGRGGAGFERSDDEEQVDPPAPAQVVQAPAPAQDVPAQAPPQAPAPPQNVILRRAAAVLRRGLRPGRNQ